ncbi:MAG: hypothetical protein J6P44_01870 [Bacteroidales bacterium]|nr:hypothetical protein [Bacteroidales bacterium]
MKKTFATIALCAFALVFGVNAMAQQGSWAGKVKYKLTWKGNVPQGVPEEWEAKIFKNLESTDFTTYISLGGLMKSISNSDNSTVTVMIDFSMLPDEGVYEGMSGKWYFREKVDLSKVTEKIKYEYTGNTKEIAGIQCSEVKVSAKSSEDGKEESELIWVTKELGPKTSMTYYPGLDAFPMEFPIDLSPELSVVFSVQECLKGKVSQADLMLESGYEEIAKEDFQEWMQKLQGAAQQGGQGDDDDDM